MDKINIGYGSSSLRPRIVMIDPCYSIKEKRIKLVGSQIEIQADKKTCKLELNKKETIKFFKFIQNKKDRRKRK